MPPAQAQRLSVYREPVERPLDLGWRKAREKGVG
jgi:hypothetical protein